MFTDCHALFHLRHYWYAGESLCFLLCPLNGTLTKCVLSTKKKLIFSKNNRTFWLKVFGNMAFEPDSHYNRHNHFQTFMAGLLVLFRWVSKMQLQTSPANFPHPQTPKKILASMYKFLCSSKCIYQVQMTMMRGSITDKFWMFTFECNVLLIQFFTVLLILNVITLPRFLINFVT